MEDYRKRYHVFIAVILLLLAILGGRLFLLQILDGEQYEATARGNAIKPYRILPARGVFYDRNGTLLVDNVPTYSITVIPRYFDESKTGLLADLVGVPDSVVAQRLQEAVAWTIERPSLIFPEVPFRVFAAVQERLSDLPGIGFEIGQKRRYVTDARAPHAFGYIREISDRELAQLEQYGYRMGDLVGKTGLERRYELMLRGAMGNSFKLVNSRGLAFSSYQGGQHDVTPTGGYNVHLTLDAGVQALAESLFVNKRGGAVALDVKTGGILALASSPDFDPAILSKPVDGETWQDLTTNPARPMLNRATMSRMPPGSTWKPFMALMALQEGLIDSTETVYCGGGHPLGGGRFFTCMHVHGPLNVVQAIQHSCNTFFFEMMYRANVDMFSRYGHMFGFGERAPTDVGEQDPGLIPDSSYFRRLTGTDDWGPGWELSLGIGQGNMVVTPLQMARYTMAIANGGTLYAPHLIDYMQHPGTGKIVYPALPAPEPIPIDPAHFKTVRKGMRKVMEAGTGRSLQIPGIPSGGKTGTAQAANKGKDDSIFIMFAPYDDPQIAIAVMVENAGYGASAAGPIASLLVEKYLTGRISDDPVRQALVRRALNARSADPPQWSSSH